MNNNKISKILSLGLVLALFGKSDLLAQRPTKIDNEKPVQTNNTDRVNSRWKLQENKIEENESSESEGLSNRMHGLALGVHGGINYNYHNTNFNSLSGVPNCCTSYSSGMQGNGINLGALVEIPISDLIALQVRGTYSDLSGATSIREFIGQKWVADKPVPVNVNHNLDANIAVASIDPIANIRLFDFPLDINAGLTFGSLVSKKAVQSEKLVSNEFLFTDTTNSRNNFSGDIPNASSMYLGALIGLGYEIMLTDKLYLSPEISYVAPFTKIAEGLDWSVSSLKFGGSLKFALGDISPLDIDGDGLTNDEEARLGTNPKNVDSDGDGLKDGEEVRKYLTNPRNPDTDNDGLTDGKEINYFGTVPNSPDTDSDILIDGEEVNIFKTDPKVADTDRDGLDDGKEIKTYLTDPLNPDTDGDGLTDGQEVTKRTDPKNVDTDHDGLQDGKEVAITNTDPLTADTDGDRLKDGQEVNGTKTDPLRKDTDGDGVNDADDLCPLIAGYISAKGCIDKQPASNSDAKPIDAKEVKKGSRLNFKEIYFIINSDKFDMERSGTINDLTRLAEYLKQCPEQRVIVEGHTSSEGNPLKNQALSEQRAESVKRWLVDQGIEEAKIQGTVGYGSRRPSVKEPDAKSAKKMDKAKLDSIRKQNRRITVQVLRACE